MHKIAGLGLLALLGIALVAVPAAAQFNFMGPRSVESGMFDNTDRTRPMYILDEEHVLKPTKDGFHDTYVSTTNLTFFYTVDEATGTTPAGNTMGPRHTWKPYGDGVCEEGKGYRYESTDPYYPYHAFYDSCGLFIGWQVIVRGPTDFNRATTSAKLQGGIQHYDPDGSWLAEFAAQGLGGPFVETVFQFTSDPAVAFPGWEGVRHHTEFMFFRNNTGACDICVEPDRGWYSDRTIIGFHLTAGTFMPEHIGRYIVDGGYYQPVKYFEFNEDGYGDKNRPVTIWSWVDTKLCLPFMGVHVVNALPPPWKGMSQLFMMYSPVTYKYFGFELDFHIIQEYGNRKYELELFGAGGVATDPAHNDFEPWNPDVYMEYYCNEGRWSAANGVPVQGAFGLSAPGSNSSASPYSYYSGENFCRTLPFPFPHTTHHMWLNTDTQDILGLCPTPLPVSSQFTDQGHDYIFRSIDGFREPLTGTKGIYDWQWGALNDRYYRYVQKNPLGADIPNRTHYYYHWLDGYEQYVEICDMLTQTLGFTTVKGGGVRANGAGFSPYSFGDPCEWCQMIQGVIQSNPVLNEAAGPVLEVFNMNDLPCMPRARRISNRLSAVPQKASEKFLNMLQVYFGMYVTFDTCSFNKDLFDPLFQFMEQCDPFRDPFCTCCSHEETLVLSNLPQCLSDYHCTTVTNRASEWAAGNYDFPGVFRYYPVSDEFPRDVVDSTTHLPDLSQIYSFTQSDTNQYVREGAYIEESTHFTTGFYFIFGMFGLTLEENGAKISDMSWTQRGDPRNNKNAASRAIGDIFVRNHNRLVGECYKGLIGCDKVDTTDDWVVFNMARRWNIANYQRILFREYVPSVLGIPLKEFDRNSDGLAYTRSLQHYNKTTLPVTSLEFSIAYRNGHAKIRDYITLRDRFFDEVEAIDITPLWNVSALFDLGTGERKEGVMEQILYGLVTDISPELGPGMSQSLRNKLQFSQGAGDDLAVWNIARGRDYGIAPINIIRKAYGLEPYGSCSDLTSNPEWQQALVELYGDNCIDRIDLWVAVLLEDITQPQSTVGSTAWQIFFDQFNSWRNSDRYYYEHQLSADVASNLDYNTLLTVDSFNGMPFSDDDIEEIYRTYFEVLISLNTNIAVGELGNNLFFVKNRQLQTLAIDGQLLQGEFDDPPDFIYSQQLSTAVKIWWRIDNSRPEGVNATSRAGEPNKGQTITIRFQSLTPGWLGFGIGADGGTMRNADIAFCFVDDNTGVGSITDRYALDVGPPQHDIDIGGHINFFNIFATQVDGSTSCQYSRPLDSGDQFDKPFEAGFTKTMFAFNPYTDEEVYHGPTRQSDIFIDYFNTYPIVELSMVIIVLYGILGGLGVLYSIFTLIIIALKEDYFRFMSPLFCQLICVGSIIAFSSVFPLMVDPPSSHSCMAYPWLLGLGYTLAFSCLFAKTWRLWRLFSRKSLKAKVIDNSFLLKIVGAMMFVIIVLLIVWTADAAFHVTLTFTDGTNSELQYLCETPTVYWGIFVGLIGLSLIVGCVLTFLIRNLPQEYNDAEAIGMSIYNSTLMLAAGAAIGWGLQDNTQAVSAAKGFCVLVAFWFLMLILFGPTHFRIFVTKKEPQTFKSTMAMGGSGGSGVSGLSSGSSHS